MNFTEHIFQGRDPNEIALYDCKEGLSSTQEMQWHELYSRVEVLADAMKNAGLRKGDRVAAVISNCAEAVVACLATLSVGAIFSTSSPDMGVAGIMDRLDQIQPRLVVFESSARYNGKVRPLGEKIEKCTVALRKVPNFQEMIVINRGSEPLDTKTLSNTTSWEVFQKRSTGKKLQFEQVAFDHPGFIVYSSGTVSLPIKSLPPSID
jgi:acetoacetyl-CoA synthetase